MPILTDAQKQTIRARLAQADVAGLGDAAAAAALSAPTTIPNPDPAAQLPRPFTVRDVVKAVPLARRPALKAYIVDLNRLAEAQDRPKLRELVLTLIDIGDLLAADGQAIQAALNATDPDPAWSATVPAPSWARQQFPGVAFPHPNPAYRDAAGNPTIRYVVDQVTPEMVAEARGNP